ncbi:hypothetical protein ACO0M4_32100 [Streptomyces sp. RGM 3693]|uniref:hypothetical protein n=1 Tax=Streptomyces sp. RGM 3693 TaxID=3413284 RepID=UPI003D2D69E8
MSPMACAGPLAKEEAGPTPRQTDRLRPAPGAAAPRWSASPAPGGAWANIARLPKDSGRPAIDVRCQDAREFEIPDDAGFFYFYEPFSTAVAASVLDNIEESLARFPRTAVLCFVGSATIPVFDGRATWSQLGETLTSPDDAYYETRLYTNTSG